MSTFDLPTLALANFQSQNVVKNSKTSNTGNGKMKRSVDWQKSTKQLGLTKVNTKYCF